MDEDFGKLSSSTNLEIEAANNIINAIEKTLSDSKSRTKDLGGSSDTIHCSNSIISNL